MISKNQRIHLFAELWRDACKTQGWKQSDRDFRLAKLSDILGREIRSTSDLDNADFDRVKKELLLLADTIPSPSSGAERGVKQRMLWLIRNEQTKCIALYRPNFGQYMQKILRDRFKRAVDLNTLADLQVSEIRMAMMTFAGRISYLRKEAGDTVHQMRLKAGLKCECAACSGRMDVPEISGDSEDETFIPDDAELAEVTENQPF